MLACGYVRFSAPYIKEPSPVDFPCFPARCGAGFRHRLRVRARPKFPTTARMSTRPLSQAGEGQTSQACPCWQTHAPKAVPPPPFSQLPVSGRGCSWDPLTSAPFLTPGPSSPRQPPSYLNREMDQGAGKKQNAPNAPYATFFIPLTRILVWKQWQAASELSLP